MTDREILFRGRRLGGGEWVYGFPVYDWADCSLKKQGKCQCSHSGELIVFIAWIDELHEYGEVEVDPATIGQYTGLRDKNGVRIFEGDRCRVTRPCILAYGKITFANGCFWFEDDGPGGLLRLCDIKPNGFEIEVTDNIHDNPELME